MIKKEKTIIESNNIEEIAYDIESQIEAMKIIEDWIDTMVVFNDAPENFNNKIALLQYFVREYCRRPDVSNIVKLIFKHCELACSIEQKNQ